QPHQPFEADRARVRLLHPEGSGHVGPDACELLQHLLARGSLDAAIDEVTPEVRLDEVPAPRRDHWRAKWITRPGSTSATKLVGCASAKPARVSGRGVEPSTAAIAYPCLSSMSHSARRGSAARQLSKTSMGCAVRSRSTAPRSTPSSAPSVSILTRS